MTCNILGSDLCLHFWLHLTPLSLSLTRFQPHWPSFCFSNTPSSFLPQGLCRYSSLFLEWSQTTASQFSCQPPQPYFSLPPSKGFARSLLPSKSITIPISLSLRLKAKFSFIVLIKSCNHIFIWVVICLMFESFINVGTMPVLLIARQ